MSIPQSGGGLIESFDQLAEYVASGCKPAAEWRIGTEHEKFGYSPETFLPLPYEGAASIKALLEGLRDRFGWAEVLEQGRIIGLTRVGQHFAGHQLALVDEIGRLVAVGRGQQLDARLLARCESYEDTSTWLAGQGVQIKKSALADYAAQLRESAARLEADKARWLRIARC